MSMSRFSIFQVVGFCSFFVAAAMAQAIQDGSYPARSYQMVTATTKYSSDGQARQIAIRVRWVTAGGQWKEVDTSIGRDGELQLKNSYKAPEAVYTSDEETNSLQFMGTASPSNQKFHSTEWLKQQPGLVGEDVLLGFTTFIYRVQLDPGHPDKFKEVYYAPKIGEIPLKSVLHFPDGSKIVQEAVAIDFIDMTEEMLARPDLPVRSDFLQKKIAEAIKSDVMRVVSSRKPQP
jgi:hypothetical protein